MGGLEGEVGGENAFGTAAPLLVQARSQIRLRAREAPNSPSAGAVFSVRLTCLIHSSESVYLLRHSHLRSKSITYSVWMKRGHCDISNEK